MAAHRRPGAQSFQTKWSGAETQGRHTTAREALGARAQKSGAGCLRFAVAWTPGNRPGGPRPPAPRSRRGGQERRWETGGAGESELHTPPAACTAPGSRGQHPDPSTLGRLCPELHPIRVNSLINPFREAEATLSVREFEKKPYTLGEGCKVSLHWPPSCTSRCLELHP